jgi:acyl-coenzyme A synthetase/AMP-(fatty) acid ligase
VIAPPAIRDAAVVGVPAVFGQRVAGFAQLASGVRRAILGRILTRNAEQLADYKVTESLTIVREIPGMPSARSTVGCY